MTPEPRKIATLGPRDYGVYGVRNYGVRRPAYDGRYETRRVLTYRIAWGHARRALERDTLGPNDPGRDARGLLRRLGAHVLTVMRGADQRHAEAIQEGILAALEGRRPPERIHVRSCCRMMTHLARAAPGPAAEEENVPSVRVELFGAGERLTVQLDLPVAAATELARKLREATRQVFRVAIEDEGR